jgi:hypothetical protein
MMSLATVAVAGFFPSAASAASSTPTVTTVCVDAQQQVSGGTSSGLTGFVAAVCVDLEKRLGVTTVPLVLPPGAPTFDLIEYTLLSVYVALAAAILLP